MTSMAANYPIGLEVAPAAPQSRLTVFFRIFMIIPHEIILYFLQIAAGVIYFIVWFAILFTGRYPAGLLNFTTGYIQWSARVGGYTYLLTGQYPPFALGDADYPLRPRLQGQVEGRNRLTTFWPIRFILTIPHMIVLAVISIAASIVLFIAWLIALFTGSVPAGMHNFLAGVMRWSVRVNAYLLLVPDQYPPFSLN